MRPTGSGKVGRMAASYNAIQLRMSMPRPVE